MNLLVRNSLIICLVTLLFSCHKNKLPYEKNEEPVFYLRGLLDLTPINLEAGNSNYYMNSSFDWDTTKVCVFKSELATENCSGNCADYAVTVLINDSKVSQTNSAVDINYVLQKQDYIFNDLDIPSMFYKVRLKPLSEFNSKENYEWTILSKNGNTEVIKSYSPVASLNANEIYSISLNYDNGSGCYSKHETYFNVGNPLQTTVTAIRDLNVFNLAIYDFSCQTTSSNSCSYFWDFGDGSTSTLATPTHTYAIILRGTQRAKVQIIDSKKDTCVTYFQVDVSGDPNCTANFNACFTALPNTKAFSAITIIIKGNDGKIYSSKNVAQPSTSKFTVTDISDYLDNKNNLPTKIVKAKIDCILSFGKERIQLRDAEISFAVAYKI